MYISSKEAEVKEWSGGGDQDIRERAGVEEVLAYGLKCSLKILSEKEAKAEAGQPEGMIWVGNDYKLCVKCC